MGIRPLPRPLVPTLLVAGLFAACGTDTERTSDAGNMRDTGCLAIEGRTVRWIVTSSPGGGLDVLSRLLEPFLESALDVEIAVENQTGVGGRTGARMLREAEPDGTTLGIVNATALLVAELSEGVSGLHPVNDFTVLGRVAIEDPVWTVSTRSSLETVDDVISGSDRNSVPFGVSDVSGSGFVFASVPAEILGLEVEYVAGYPGGREYGLGLIRGEFDVGGFSFESSRDRIEAGDLRPILQIANAPVADHPSLRGVPLLGGVDGLAARAARSRGEDPSVVARRVEALLQLFQAGRIIVAPPRLPSDVAECLGDALGGVTSDPDFLSRARQAGRTVSFRDAASIESELGTTSEARELLEPILRRHIDMVRR